MMSFEYSWPGGCHGSMPKRVTTIAFSKKHIKVGYVKVFNTETIYARGTGAAVNVLRHDQISLNLLLGNTDGPPFPEVVCSVGLLWSSTDVVR